MVRWEEEVLDVINAIWKRADENSLNEVRYKKKGRCMYQISDEFARVARRDLNIRDVHVLATHKLRTYALFKVEFGMEGYLACMTDVQKRVLLACLRSGVLRLRIESGRYEKNGVYAYSGVPIEYRVCMFCDMSKVEDEIHFVCECNLYNELRKHLKRVCRREMKYDDWQDGQACFIKLMQSKSSVVMRALGDFVYQAYFARSARLKELEQK